MPDSEETPAFSALLRRQRLAAGLTQGTLAERAGLAARTIQDLERGIAQPRRETVRRLVEVLAPRPEIRAHFESASPAPRDRNGRTDRVRCAGRTAEPRGTSTDEAADQPDWADRQVRLPVSLTSLVGRGAELAAIADLMPSTRLLTLVGVGGVGKTRLALEAARTVQSHYADGVRLVELAAVADETLVSQAVAKVFGIAEQPGRTLLDTVIGVLQSRQVLLMVDNCEHLLDGCASLVQRLLNACDDLQVLATSREPLGVEGEAVWRVPPLTIPGGDVEVRSDTDLTRYGAVQLFVDRARLVQPSFDLAEDAMPAVIEICQRLDGIPLAIELAAARVPFLTVRQIADRLDDQLSLLTHGRRTALPRHRTLRATLDWSYDLLAEPEQALLCRLAVFAGGWTLEAAEAVCGGDGIERADVLELISRLVDASLVIVTPEADEARYRLLEPVRQYALERLRQTPEEDAVRARHASWCLALAEQGEPELWRADQLRWFDRLEVEHDNLRAALAWSIRADGSTEVGLRLAGALLRFWDMGGYWAEGRRWSEEALRVAPNEQGPAIIKVLIGVGPRVLRQTVHPRDVERTTRLCGQAFELAQRYGDTHHAVLALNYAGFAAHMQGEYEQARRAHEDALALARRHADKLGIARTLDLLGRLEEYDGNYLRSVVLLEEALALHRERGDRVSVAFTLATLCLVERRRGAYERAMVLGEESLALYRVLRDSNGLAFILQNLGRVAHLQGEHARARALFEESLRLWREIGSRTQALRSLEGLAGVIAAEGWPDRAVRLLIATETLTSSIGRALSPAEQAVYKQLLSAARADLDEAVFAAARADGRAMSFDEAVVYALEEPMTS